MGVDEVHVLEVESLEGELGTLNDVLSREALVVDGVVAKGTAPVNLLRKYCQFMMLLDRLTSISHLCRNDQVVAFPAELSDGLSHDDLGLAFAIDLGAVEEVNTTVIGGFHALEGGLCCRLSALAHKIS